tara:strand:- start:238 stop:732 length:495 start_codon:yes stop_codon:yes gene_type:complete
MKIATVRAAIQLIHEPEIDSLWEYEDCDERPLWAAYTEEQSCDIYGSCTALKHDGKITGMGQEFLNTHKDEWSDYENAATQCQRWWEGKHNCDPRKFSDRYYVKLLTQIIDRECNEAMDTTQHCSSTVEVKTRMNLKSMLAESNKVKRMLKEASDEMEETTWED